MGRNLGVPNGSKVMLNKKAWLKSLFLSNGSFVDLKIDAGEVVVHEYWVESSVGLGDLVNLELQFDGSRSAYCEPGTGSDWWWWMKRMCYLSNLYASPAVTLRTALQYVLSLQLH